MRAWSLAAVVKSILSNLTVINIIFFIFNILTVNNIVIKVLVVPILPLLVFLAVEVKVNHHLNNLVPITGVTSIQVLISAWIWCAKMVSYWLHSLDLALILTMSFIIRLAYSHFFLGGRLINLHGHLFAAQSSLQLFIINLKILKDDILNVLFSTFMFKILKIKCHI